MHYIYLSNTNVSLAHSLHEKFDNLQCVSVGCKSVYSKLCNCSRYDSARIAQNSGGHVAAGRWCLPLR